MLNVTTTKRFRQFNRHTRCQLGQSKRNMFHCVWFYCFRFFLLFFFSLVIRHASSREPKKNIRLPFTNENEREHIGQHAVQTVGYSVVTFVHSLLAHLPRKFHCIILPKIAVNCIDRLRSNV